MERGRTPSTRPSQSTTERWSQSISISPSDPSPPSRLSPFLTYEYEFASSETLYEEYFAFGMTSFHSMNGAYYPSFVSARRYRYNGKERDEETGLYYYGARYYAAWLGRWTAVDPSVGDGFNAYSYVRNNPIGLADPTGEQSDVVNKLPSSDFGGTTTLNFRTMPVHHEPHVSPHKTHTASQKPTELHVPGRSTSEPVNIVVTPKERPQDQSAAPPPAAKKDELTAQTGLGRIAEAGAKGDYKAVATEYALAIVTEIPNVAVAIGVYGAVKKAIAAGHEGGPGAAFASAAWSYAGYVGGLIPVLPALGGAYESGQRAGETHGSAKVGASVDTYFYSLQAITQVVGFFGGGGKIGEEASAAEGGWIGRLFENKRGGNPTRALLPEDLGLPNSAAVVGKFSLREGKATAYVQYLGEGPGGLGEGLLRARSSLKRAARAEGASTLRIETTRIVEETGRLARILKAAGFQERPDGTMWWEGSLR